MAATTALTLVNRLLRRHRLDDVSTFAAPEAVLALELINTSVRELLAMRDYPWNIRSDGALTLLGTITGTSGLSITELNPDSGSINPYSSGISTVTGSVVTRVMATDSELPSTALVLSNAGKLTATFLVLSFRGDWPGDDYTGAYKIFFSEYVLPDAVAKVISVRSQSTPTRLIEVEPHATWDYLNPRPQDTEDGDMLIVGIGGTAVATYNSAVDEVGDHGLRLMVWPIPNDRILLNYTYKERLTEMSAVDSILYSPAEFCDDVIERAEQKSYENAWQNDPALAELKARTSGVSTNLKYANSRLDPSRRHVIRALDRPSADQKVDPTPYRSITGL